MIDQTRICFPDNVVEILAENLKAIDPESSPGEDDGVRIVRRPVRNTDLTETISVIPGTWEAQQETLEILGGRSEPTVQRYTVVVESLIVDMDEERGIRTNSLFSAMVRHMLYRDPAIRIALPLLSVSLNGYTESLKRWGLSQQRFMNNEVGSNFIFLSAVELWFETDIKNT